MLKKLCFLFVLALAAVIGVRDASALFTSPDKLVIEDGQRSTEVVVSNRSKQPVVVRLEWERIVMTPQGEMKRLAEGETYPGYEAAEPYLKFSPRQVILQPFQHQKIRVLVRRTNDMPEGEYHSHLLIKEEPISKKEEVGDAAQKGVMSGKFDIIVYRSLPVFLRNGKTAIDFDLDASIQVENGKPFFHMDVVNRSTRSAYPNPTLTCALPSGETKSVRLLALRLYTEAKTLKTKVPVPLDFDYKSCQSLTANFIDKKDFEYKGSVMKSVPVSIR